MKVFSTLRTISLSLFCLGWLTTVGAANEPPAIIVAGGTIRYYPHGVEPPPIDFTISDEETPASALQVFISSSDPSTLPPTDMAIVGSGNYRSLIIKLTSAFSTVVAVTLTVVDADGASSSVQLSFFLNSGVDFYPTISQITDQIIWENTSSMPLQFSVVSAIFQTDKISVFAHSLDTNLIADTGITLSSSSQYRIITIHPTIGRSGHGIVAITATDPEGNKRTAQLLVSIIPANAPLNKLSVEQLKFKDHVWMQFTGRFSNSTYSLELSTNLAKWTYVSTIAVTNELFGYKYESPTNSPQGFFRLKRWAGQTPSR